MLRIWLNHWFSTARNIIYLLREDNFDLWVIGSNENKHSIIKGACNEWYQEPVLKDDDYVDFCLDFCIEHKVDVFMPRRGMLNISKNKERFDAIGTKVMVDDFEIVSVLNQKEEAYKYFRDNRLAPIPENYTVTNVQSFMDAYEKLKANYDQVCFKFVKDEGGKSFRLIDNQRKGYAALFKKQNTRMTLDDVIEALSEREEFAPIMIMPFLSGDEVSVDCLNTEQGLIALPRVKGYEKYETLRYDEEILNYCKVFQEHAKLYCPYNIQFKYLDGSPYFLEVNTRMSGGIHMACLASGVNIPQIGLRKLLGENQCWTNTYETKIVSQIYQPVIIE